MWVGLWSVREKLFVFMNRSVSACVCVWRLVCSSACGFVSAWFREWGNRSLGKSVERLRRDGDQTWKCHGLSVSTIPAVLTLAFQHCEKRNYSNRAPRDLLLQQWIRNSKIEIEAFTVQSWRYYSLSGKCNTSFTNRPWLSNYNSEHSSLIEKATWRRKKEWRRNTCIVNLGSLWRFQQTSAKRNCS
jgi:hypothetical protein